MTRSARAPVAWAALVGLVWSYGCYAITDFDGLEGGASSGASSSAGSGAASSSSSTGGVGGEGNGGLGGTASSAGGGGTASSAGGGGTGGTPQCPPPNVDYGGLVLNEMVPKGSPEDWIELYNAGSETIPLCAVFITQGYDGMTPPTGSDRYTFGLGDLGAGQYLVITSPTDFPFGLAKDEPERITLFAPDGVVLDDTSWVVDITTEFLATESWARIPNATGPFKRISSPTQGAENFELGGGGGAGGGL